MTYSHLLFSSVLMVFPPACAVYFSRVVTLSMEEVVAVRVPVSLSSPEEVVPVDRVGETLADLLAASLPQGRRDEEAEGGGGQASTIIATLTLTCVGDDLGSR